LEFPIFELGILHFLVFFQLVDDRRRTCAVRRNFFVLEGGGTGGFLADFFLSRKNKFFQTLEFPIFELGMFHFFGKCAVSDIGNRATRGKRQTSIGLDQ
jgi:hypothetical protein